MIYQICHAWIKLLCKFLFCKIWWMLKISVKNEVILCVGCCSFSAKIAAVAQKPFFLLWKKLKWEKKKMLIFFWGGKFNWKPIYGPVTYGLAGQYTDYGRPERKKPSLQGWKFNQHILSATSAQFFRYLWFMPSLGVRSTWANRIS